MLSDGISSIGDGLLEVAEGRLKGLLVTEDINEIYDVEQTPFARGKFAAVRRAIHKGSGVHFAAKFLKRRRRAQSSDKEIKHEIAVLILCSGCENIVKLNAVHETRSDTALLLELATGGELQAILDNEGSLSEAQTRICMIQVIKALQYLHKRSIAHLDLKPQNILLTGKKAEDGLKLCDFGISRVIESGSKVREILGTPDYVAPEVLQYEPLSLQTDIWSVGVLTYVLLSGCSPFGGDTKQETFLNISQCNLTFPDELFEGVSQYAIDFIKSTLRIKPYDRLTALECLEHVWLKEESIITDTLLTLSGASEDLTDENEDDSQDAGEEKQNGQTNRKFTNQQYRTENGSDDSGNQRTHSWSGRDSSENNKENFIAYISNNSVTSNGISNGLVISSVNAQSKISSNTIKYSSTIVMSSDSCTLNKNRNSNISNSEISCCNYTEKQKEYTELKSGTNTTTTATICLFPDAPTTPKVIRKAPPCTSKSVKALVKKFQLEVDELQGNNIERDNSDRDSCTNTANTSKCNGRTSNNDRGSGNSFKNSCAFCLKCSGPGCRHSGNTTINKSSSAINMDHGIIC